ncbi:MAG: DUF4332 domain-containing protein [Planctomycetota bacterium]|jgi:hypothetical protein
MHLVRLDIDKKNTASQFQVGPMGGGLNAVYSPIATASALLTKFVKNVLFQGQTFSDLEDSEFEAIDGSLTWVDASGHLRMISCAGGAPVVPSRFVHSPLHPSSAPIYEDDVARIRGIGNMFWEGDEEDGRWDDMRSDILAMIFCSPLGSVSPEKLWWSASKLGVHAAARTQLDEGYEHLKKEERDLLDRLRHAETVDHDRTWWTIERDRIQAELVHVGHANAQRAASVSGPVTPLEDRLATIRNEIARQRNVSSESERRADPLNQDSVVSERSEDLRGVSVAGNTTSPGSSSASKLDWLLAEQATLEGQIRQHLAQPQVTAGAAWDDTQLRQQLAHAEEMIRRWDRRSHWHRRLAEVQSHLKTRSPYRRTADGSLIPSADKFLRELTAGAVRQLPPWAIEASYLHSESTYGPSDAYDNGLRMEASQRGDWLERAVPGPNTRQRRLVDLAIRLAIATASATRIGRIPMLLEHSIDGFRGEPLEQLLHVLATAARDGRQILVTTADEFIARRIAAHGGSVARVHENLRYAKPHYVIDTDTDLGVHPVLDRAPVVSYGVGLQPDSRAFEPTADGRRMPSQPDTSILEVNRTLDGLAAEEQQGAWWLPQTRRPAASVQPLVYTVRGKTYFLSSESPLEHVPGLSADVARRLRSIGMHRVVDLTSSSAERIASVAGLEIRSVQRILGVVDLMLRVPQMRTFDARVLVSCGIRRAADLQQVRPQDLAARVQAFLDSESGRALIRTASEPELARLQNWIAEIRGNRSTPVETTMEPGVRIHRTKRLAKRRKKVKRPFVEIEQEHEDAGRPVTEVVVKPGTTASHWKFYLELGSPVVDAPTIGPKMAEKLHAISIRTVGDLVAAEPAEIADALAEKPVTAKSVLEWQQQSLLVCRIPNLRGHEAQLLVAAGYTTAELVAAANADALFDAVVRVASSRQGIRYLRGGQPPDRARAGQWVDCAHHSRAVRAA